MRHIQINIENSESINKVLGTVFSLFREDNIDNSSCSNDLFNAIMSIHAYESANISLAKQEDVCAFLLQNKDTNKIIEQIENAVCNSEELRPMKQIVSYFLDEMVCNMQQHSKSEKGFAFAKYNTDLRTIDLCLADKGITIYGSFIEKQLYLDLIGNSDAQALSLAKDGYSTKNLPNAENRGYGISSNAKLIVEGLGGVFSIMSGNALLLYDKTTINIFELPESIEWSGTLVIARIPVDIPESFNFYKYIS